MSYFMDVRILLALYLQMDFQMQIGTLTRMTENQFLAMSFILQEEL